MRGKVFGIPLELYVVIFGLVLFIDVPVYYMTRVTNSRIDRLAVAVNEANMKPKVVVLPTPTVPVTPTVSVKMNNKTVPSSQSAVQK